MLTGTQNWHDWSIRVWWRAVARETPWTCWDNPLRKGAGILEALLEERAEEQDEGRR